MKEQTKDMKWLYLKHNHIKGSNSDKIKNAEFNYDLDIFDTDLTQTIVKNDDGIIFIFFLFCCKEVYIKPTCHAQSMLQPV